ncbi:hypothetical protein ORI89_17320 [Sphingobacterium sp. UT-1RO-CII-1]|uniref:hypothetical protein n=1 Tax=Sphingobacterium sp. UT-1RO-CII-1 TaxID=2995225 RepID=UPI00227AB105|nr:hypothetical protein [Sphingobacterium sp. UT-1RO-CII-1]MCY4781423.1 hypothetical protein [Sphingobacterium sp. UT-1RO-CII-1]
MNRTVIPKPRAKVKLTKAREYAILKDVQFIGTVIQVVQNKWRENLFDTELRGQTLKNFSNQIYKGAHGMERELRTKFNLNDPEELEYELATSMDRVISFFCLMPSGLINSIMDRLEAEKRAIELEHNGVVPMEVQPDVYDIAPEREEVQI